MKLPQLKLRPKLLLLITSVGGVGLALVKRIVEIHNGEVWIESQDDGQGCCFCFTLPA